MPVRVFRLQPVALMILNGRIVYAIEATVHAPTWEGVYEEIRKVLKPGGIVRLALLQACILLELTPPFCPVRRLRVVHDRRVGPINPLAQGTRSRN